MTYRFSQYNRHGNEDRPRRRRNRRPPVNVNRAEVLQITAAAIDANGWTSAGAATANGGTPTKDHVAACFGPDGKLKAKADRALVIRTADKATAASALAWAAQQTGSEYARKIAELAEEETTTITTRELGLACSIVGCYLRDVERQAQRAIEDADRAARAKTVTHIGAPGTREIFTLTLDGVREVNGSFGTCNLHKFRDAAGNEVTWFASSYSGMEIGRTYQVKATVKRHGDFRGLPTTTVNRCTNLGEVKAA